MSTAQQIRTRVLLRRAARTHDEQRRADCWEKAILLNRDLATALAARYRDRGVEQEDLDQVATLALVKAVHAYDPDRGPSFIGFAIPTITGELKRYFRDHGWLVRPPRSLQETSSRVRQIMPELEQATGRSPSISECAAELNLSTDEVDEALQADAGFSGVSLETNPWSRDHDRLERHLAHVPRDYRMVENVIALRPAVLTLSARDRIVLHLRFVDELSQAEIGERIGVGQMQVSRILRQILGRLRTELLALDAAS